MRSRANFTFRAWSIGALLCLGGIEELRAQTPPQICMDLIHTLPPGFQKQDVFSALAPGQAAYCLAKALYPHSPRKAGTAAFLRSAAKVQNQSNAIQGGAPTSSNGTTSAVSKPFSPLSLATEYGGITSSTNNQTVTLQIPLDGIPRALATSGRAQYCTLPSMKFEGSWCVSPKLLNTLDKFSFGVSVNTATSTNTATATASGAAMSGAQAVTAKNQGTGGPSFSSATAKFTLVPPSIQLPANTPLSGPAAAAEAPIALRLNGDLEGTQYDVWRRCFAEAFFNAHGADRDTKAIDFFNQLEGVLP